MIAGCAWRIPKTTHAHTNGFLSAEKGRDFEMKVKQSYTPSRPGINGLLRASTRLTLSHVGLNLDTPGVGQEDLVVTPLRRDCK